MKAEMSKTFLNNLIRLQPDQSFRDTQKETFKEFQKPLISASNSTLSIKDIITPRPTKKQAQVFNFKNPYIALKRDSKADISKSNMKSPISQHTDFKKREGVKAQHLTNKSKNAQSGINLNEKEPKRTKHIDTPRIVKTEQCLEKMGLDS